MAGEFEAAVTARLQDFVTAADGRAYYIRLPDESAFPALTWQLISDPPIIGLGDEPVKNALQPRLQISLYAQEGETVVAMTAQVRAAINNWKAAGTGYEIDNGVVSGVTDVLWGQPTPPAYGRVVDAFVYWHTA